MRHYPRSWKTRSDSIAVGKGHVFNHGVPDTKTRRDRSVRYGKTFASATLVSSANYANTETVTVDGVVYTILAVLVDAIGNVKRGANEAATMLNLSRAINASGGTPGTDYATAQTAHPTVTAASDGVHTITITSRFAGSYGNDIVLSTTAGNAVAGVMTGGC